MIDTVVLTLNQDMFTIIDHQKFSPSTEGLYRGEFYRLGSRANIVCKQNPTTTELKNGIYKPRLSVTKRISNNRFQVTLKIEFSIPKLIFNNNFDEVVDDNFGLVISTLQEKLKEMGVLVFTSCLTTAPVSAIHYSKNILLTDGSTPYMYLKEFSKANLNQRLDLNQTDFRNEGHSLKFRTNSFEVVFYDKLKDLQKAKISEKRTIEHDNAIQLNLFEKLQTRKPLEVLRMEVRLNRGQKIRQIFGKLGIKAEPIFREIFKKEISQAILLFYFQQLKNSYPPILGYKPKSNKELLAELIINNPKLKLRQINQVLGFKNAVDELGIREYREMIKKFGKANWYRLYKFIKKIRFSQVSFPAFTKLEQALTEFKPVKLVDFQERMLNNDKNE
ncbi:hypothetical protein J7J95_00050 [bacterium]|nr:hypothetical protein [bacterium]